MEPISATVALAPFGTDWMPRVERWRSAHRIVGIYEEEVTKEIHGESITRSGSENDPVVLIEGKDGLRALKRASELEIF
jgi:hypothetical protein